MKDSLLFYVIVGFVLLVCLKVYYDSENFSLKCIISSVDGNKYCVRDKILSQDAADLLAKVTVKCKELVVYVGEKYPSNHDVKKLVENFNPKKISETLPTSDLTAYSENKGEKIAFCLNKTKNGNELIDLNTLTFVAIHELSHVMTKSIGHKQEFWENFKFLLENATTAGIYKSIDYSKDPQSYCGIQITDSPVFSL
jgi:hypothetical protein